MVNLPPNTVEVAPENKCDVCKENDAKYYNITFYIHICSIKCFEEFIIGYNRETDEIARDLQRPDGTSVMREKKDDL